MINYTFPLIRTNLSCKLTLINDLIRIFDRKIYISDKGT